MKRILHEEEYNQIVKIGKIYDKNIIKKLQHRLSVMGIDSHVDGDEVYITVEQDKNDPHYVDDIVDIAKKVLAKLSDNGFSLSSFKLAENEFKWVCNECIKRLLEASVFNDAMFAIVKAQAKKMARKKILQMCQNYKKGEQNTPKTRFDKCVYDFCEKSGFINENELVKLVCLAIDKLMDAECKRPDMTEYDMFLNINNDLKDYINN